MLTRLLVDIEGVPILTWERVADGDGWDGYPTERNEIMTALRTQSVKNVVGICGDIHAHFAGVVMDNYDAASPNPVGVELTAAGVTSNSLFWYYYARAVRFPPEISRVVTFDASADGGAKIVENLNMTLLHGTVAAKTYAETGDLEAGLAAAQPINPHLKYADSNAQGYGLMTVTATETRGTLVTVNRPVQAFNAAQGPGILRSARFVIPKDNPAGMTGPEITGTKPVPFT
jgi:alkaline phosphatase D